MRIRLWHFRFNLALHRFWSLVFRAAAAGSMERVETKRNQPEAEMDEMAALPFAFFAF